MKMPVNSSSRRSSVIENLESRRLLSAAVFGVSHSLSAADLLGDLQAGRVELMTPSGETRAFDVVEKSILDADVAAAHPDLHTFRGVAVDDPQTIAAFDLTTLGFNALVLDADHGTWLVQPSGMGPANTGAGEAMYTSSFMDDALRAEDFSGFAGDGCELLHDHDDHIDHDNHDHADDLAGGFSNLMPAPTGPTHYQMRLAVAANGEWTQSVGGTQSAALSRIVTAVNTADLLYNQQFGIGFTLVTGTETIYTNPSSDPYTGNSGSSMLLENQNVIDSIIGDANYDIGHVFSRSGGGVAYLGVVGQPSWKARGVSGNNPNFNSYLLTFWHEMGHQFSSPHTWNSVDNAQYNNQRSAGAAYEPGPGSTIMSYGGFNFTGDFVNTRDPYFHAESVRRITDYVQFDNWGSTAGNRTSTGNAIPQVNAGVDRVIPANTPFELTDQSGTTEPLTYQWDQYDLGDDDVIGIDDGDGPLFRSRPATSDPTRIFPELPDILANRSDADELLPQVTRTADPLTFRLVVRDGDGGVAWDDVDLAVINTGSRFEVTTANATGTVWGTGSQQTVTWNVAGTTGNGINAANVDIYLSYNDGLSFNLVAAGQTNDGSATIVVPADAPATNRARLKIKAAGNVFFDINNAQITIQEVDTLDVTALAFDYEQRQAVDFSFNRPINPSTLAATDLVVENLTTGQTLASNLFSLSATDGTNQNFTLNYNIAANGPMPNGDYRVTIPAFSVTGANGGSLDQDTTATFFVLAGDANRDRTVDLADFVILRNNFGSGTLFSQADFSYDDQVDLDDFVILRNNFGATLD